MMEAAEVTGNRAVSALFRVFGGAGRREIADGFERTTSGGMHPGERLILGWIVPLTFFAALSEGLVNVLGSLGGWLLLLPLGFFLLTVLAYLVPGRKVSVQWWSWLLLFTLWGWWRKDAGGYVSWFAWMWVGIFALNLIAHLLLAFGATMRIRGWPGMIWRLGLLVGLHLIAFADHWFWGWGWAIVGGMSISSIYCAAVLHPYRQWLGPVKCRNEAGTPLITIDDGPCPAETPKLLDLLDLHGTKAVFFMIGEKVGKHPELAREVVRRGHEIGNHTMTHPQATFWCAGPWRTRREIRDCQEAIREATGVTPTKFRAPVGHRNLFTHPVAGEMGLQVVAWNRRGFDAVLKDPEKVLRQILPLTGGDIVLMHEGTGIAAEVLSEILKAGTSRPD
jgi:peptidoglycan/xylan/chitin deacetylase (PgdA/CDA1 family)